MTCWIYLASRLTFGSSIDSSCNDPVSQDLLPTKEHLRDSFAASATDSYFGH